jgi:hypothetical protein
MHIAKSLEPAAASDSLLVACDSVRTFPGAGQPRKRVSASGISAEDKILASAWSQVAYAITGYHVGPLEDGGECILVTTGVSPNEAEANARWLIWRDRGRVLARRTGLGDAPAEHVSMQEALQAIAALSGAEMRSVTLIAEAMLRFINEADDSVNFAMAA